MASSSLLTQIPLGNITGINNTPVQNPNTTSIISAIQAADVFSKIIGFLTVIGFLWFILQIVTAAIQLIASSGEKTNVQAARMKIEHSIIGLIVIVTAIFVIYLLAALLGLSDVLTFGLVIQNLMP